MWPFSKKPAPAEMEAPDVSEAAWAIPRALPPFVDPSDWECPACGHNRHHPGGDPCGVKAEIADYYPVVLDGGFSFWSRKPLGRLGNNGKTFSRSEIEYTCRRCAWTERRSTKNQESA